MQVHRIAAFGVVFALGALAGTATTTWAGSVPALVVAPAVVPAGAQVRVAPSGKAWITPLVTGRSAFVGRLELAPGAAVPEHRDATEEIIHVLAGGGVITIDGASHEIGPGATVLMPADALVTYQNGAERLVALQVFAGPAPARKYEAWQPIAAGDAP